MSDAPSHSSAANDPKSTPGTSREAADTVVLPGQTLKKIVEAKQEPPMNCATGRKIKLCYQVLPGRSVARPVQGATPLYEVRQTTGEPIDVTSRMLEPSTPEVHEEAPHEYDLARCQPTELDPPSPPQVPSPSQPGSQPPLGLDPETREPVFPVEDFHSATASADATLNVLDQLQARIDLHGHAEGVATGSAIDTPESRTSIYQVGNQQTLKITPEAGHTALDLSYFPVESATIFAGLIQIHDERGYEFSIEFSGLTHALFQGGLRHPLMDAP